MKTRLYLNNERSGRDAPVGPGREERGHNFGDTGVRVRRGNIIKGNKPTCIEVREGFFFRLISFKKGLIDFTGRVK